MPRNVSEDEVKLLGSAGERFAFADLEDDEEEDEEVVWDAASGAARLVRPNGSGATGSAGFAAAAPTPSKAPGRMPPGKAQHWDKLMLTAWFVGGGRRGADCLGELHEGATDAAWDGRAACT